MLSVIINGELLNMLGVKVFKKSFSRFIQTEKLFPHIWNVVFLPACSPANGYPNVDQGTRQGPLTLDFITHATQPTSLLQLYTIYPGGKSWW